MAVDALVVHPAEMNRSTPTLSAIVATYEWPDALNLVLQALAEQSDSSFEVIVADDGSGAETLDVVNVWRKTFGSRLTHVWQTDDGWRKARILNVGALAASGDYLVFLDGDVIPRRSFVAAVRRAALPGWFLSTKRVYLSEDFSRRVFDQRFCIWRWSTARWMVRAPREVTRPGYLVPMRDRRRAWRPDLPDFAPSDNAYGFFLGVSRADFERVNGHDIRFIGRDNEDADLAVRLRRIGLRCGWPGPGATMFHLWHPRVAGPRTNEPLFFETQASHRVQAVVGLREVADQESAKRVAASSSSSEPVNR